MVRLAAAAVLVAAASAALASADTYYTGDGTAYTLGSVSSGNCNFMYDPGVGSNYAALNSDQWDSTMNCGRCAEVSCADSKCSDTTSTVTVYLVDQCPECSEGDLDLSPTVFKTLTGSDPARYSIKWRFVDCPVSGNLQYCAKSGSSNYWLAIQPANMVSGIASMTIGGQTPTMVDSAFYFLVQGGVDITSVTVATTSVSGETVTETVSLTADSCTEGSKQFSGGSSSTSSSSAQTTTSAPSTTSSAATTSAPTTTSPASTTSAPTATPTSTPTPTTATPTTASSASASGADDSAGLSTQTTDSTQNVAGDFDTLNDGSNSSVPGTVSAANDDASSGVSILDSSETGVANTSPTAASSAGSDSSVQDANTQSSDSSAATSPVLIALAVAAAVGAVALAAVYVRVQKKKIDDKRNDRDDAAMQRSFDTFSSPVRVQSAIAQL